MSDEVEISASFDREAQVLQAIEILRHAGYRPQVFAPVPSEKIQEALAVRKSPVRVWVLTGGITGALSGFALTIGTSLTFPHYVGGKPLISITPFIIIAFELMILFGALSGIAGFLIHGRFPQIQTVPGYAPRFNQDRFGIALRCAPRDRLRIERLLSEAGAEEIERDSV